MDLERITTFLLLLATVYLHGEAHFVFPDQLEKLAEGDTGGYKNDKFGNQDEVHILGKPWGQSNEYEKFHRGNYPPRGGHGTFPWRHRKGIVTPTFGTNNGQNGLRPQEIPTGYPVLLPGDGSSASSSSASSSSSSSAGGFGSAAAAAAAAASASSGGFSVSAAASASASSSSGFPFGGSFASSTSNAASSASGLPNWLLSRNADSQDEVDQLNGQTDNENGIIFASR